MGRKKRVREADATDSAGPISKKINQLHIEKTSIESNDCEAFLDLPDPRFPSELTTNENVSLNGHHHHQQQQQQQQLLPTEKPQNMNNSNFLNDFNSDADIPTTSSSFPPNPNLTFASRSCESYRPELNKDENPHYYSINEQLYYIHMDKINRSKSSH